MNLTEPIDSINAQLVDLFGIDTITGLPMWRVVWSEDQIEKRFGTYEDRTSSGIFIRRVTEVREVPKYRQWIQRKFVLEQLVIVPTVDEQTLPTSKLSYEPLWVFEDKNGNYLPPKVNACKLIIDTVYATKGKSSLARYADPESTQEGALEVKRKEVDSIVEELFGNESDLCGTSFNENGSAIFVPSNYVKEN